MKKIFMFCMIAIVAMCALNSCSNDCDHEFVEVDYTQELVGVWTCMEEGYAEALVIKDNGSIVSTGLEGDRYWEDVKGTWKVSNNKVTMIFEDNDNFEGRFDLVPGDVLSLVDGKTGERTNYYYCHVDLSEVIVGLWVCNDGPAEGEQDMSIHTFNEDGTLTLTGFDFDGSAFVNQGGNTYKVVGDLLFTKVTGLAGADVNPYVCMELIYFGDGYESGGMLNTLAYLPINAEGEIDLVSQYFLSVKQSLNLTGKKYDYRDIYVTNVKGLDKDIQFHPEYTFNFAKMDGVLLDKILKSILFTIEFPDANTFKYSCSYPNPNTSLDARMVVDGNKVTVKMSERNPAYCDIDFYMFQDYDECELHMYLPTYSFINFYGNMQIIMMEQLGQIDTTDAAAVKAVYDSLDDAVDTINVSFVMEASK